MVKTFALFISLIFLSSNLIAETALETMFKSIGGKTNISKPGVFRDQSAGYYTGGGAMMRGNVSGFTPIQASLPKFGAHCGGIDAYLGSISFVGGKEMLKALRGMGTGVATYAFQLALKTMAPQIESTFSQLRKILLEANQMMLGDCRMVQQMVAGALPKESEMYKHACTDVNSQGHHSTDWFGAKQRCQKTGRADAVKEIKTGDRGVKNKDLLMGEFNITWHALSKMSGMSSQMKEFIMSVVGTIISKKEGDNFKLKYIEGKADNKKFIEALLKGGKTQLLVCSDKGKCINPSLSEVSFAPAGDNNPCMKVKIFKKINAIRNKYIEKGALNLNEITFLNDSVKLPVWKYIQVSVASGAMFLLSDAVEFIAVSVLLSQFDRAAAEVISSLDALQSVQINDESVKILKDKIQDTRLRLQIMIGNANNGAIFRLNKMIKTYEHEVVLQRGG